MPSATLFRLVIATEKPVVNISAFHLYDDNTRVDDNATIQTAIINNPDTNYLKNNVPVEDQFVTTGNTALVRKTTLYITWSFSVAVNVNAFRVGSAESIDTFLDQFHLQYSDDGGLTFISFISIASDKKLTYPGPWQLSALKPVGESFPLVLSQEQLVIGYPIGYPLDIGEDGRSFISTPDLRGIPTTVSSTGYMDSTGVFINIPGFFKTGKYYFEASRFFSNDLLRNDSSNIILCFLPDDTERKNITNIQGTRGFGFSITGPYNYEIYSSNSTFGPSSVEGSGLSTTYTPGYFSGFTIDFDNREVKFYYPKWKLNPVIVDLPLAETIMKTYPVGTRYKLCFAVKTKHLMPTIFLDVGQNTFTQTVPSGFNPGLGPRWSEDVDISVVAGRSRIENINKNSLPYFVDTSAENISMDEPLIISKYSSGAYYIKGTITRVPDAINKKFIVTLYSVNLKRNIAQCRVSGSGLYEFLNLAYGAYVVTSFDSTNNTVAECIGPIYPIEMTS